MGADEERPHICVGCGSIGRVGWHIVWSAWVRGMDVVFPAPAWTGMGGLGSCWVLAAWNCGVAWIIGLGGVESAQLVCVPWSRFGGVGWIGSLGSGLIGGLEWLGRRGISAFGIFFSLSTKINLKYHTSHNYHPI